ncbi:hypothetical protein FB33_2663 [Cutibacterium acnes]|nr:hypothetical protein FB33_2663 [Cutibacterium acnes]
MSIEGIDGNLKVEFAGRAYDGDDVIEGPWADQTAVRL